MSTVDPHKHRPYAPPMVTTSSVLHRTYQSLLEYLPSHLERVFRIGCVLLIVFSKQCLKLLYSQVIDRIHDWHVKAAALDFEF